MGPSGCQEGGPYFLDKYKKDELTHRRSREFAESEAREWLGAFEFARLVVFLVWTGFQTFSVDWVPKQRVAFRGL